MLSPQQQNHGWPRNIPGAPNLEGRCARLLVWSTTVCLETRRRDTCQPLVEPAPESPLPRGSPEELDGTNLIPMDAFQPSGKSGFQVLQDDTTQAMSLRDVGVGKGRRLRQFSGLPDELGCQQTHVEFLDVRPVQLPSHSGNMLLLGPPDSTLEASSWF